MRAVLRLRVFAVRLVGRGLQYLINERLEELWVAAGLLRLAVPGSISFLLCLVQQLGQFLPRLAIREYIHFKSSPPNITTEARRRRDQRLVNS